MLANPSPFTAAERECILRESVSNVGLDDDDDDGEEDSGCLFLDEAKIVNSDDRFNSFIPRNPPTLTPSVPMVASAKWREVGQDG